MSRDVRRLKWPLSGRSTESFEDFRGYLLATKGLKAASADQYVQKVQYFVGMLDFAAPGFSKIDFASSLYTTGLFGEMLKLQILQPHLHTTRHVCSALWHFCDFALLLCGQQNLQEPARCITLLKAEFLGPLKKRAQAARSAAAFRKGDRDADAIGKLPPHHVFKTAIKEAMLDLHTLWQLKQKEGTLGWQAKYAVNVIMAGITFANSYAGRPGEWATMTRKEIEEFLAGAGEVLVMERHKTVKTHGPLGRWVPPGNVAAMKKVMAIHQPEAKLFLDPIKDSTKAVSMAKILEKWGSVYTPEFQAPLPTLMRKWFHTTAAAAGTGGAAQFAALCRLDGHSVGVGQKTYVVKKVQEQARDAKAMFIAFAGEPVPWPKARELAEGRGRSEERINLNFYRQAAASDSEDGSEDLDACSPSNDDDEEEGDAKDEPANGGSPSCGREGVAVKPRQKRKCEPAARTCKVSSAGTGASSSAAAALEQLPAAASALQLAEPAAKKAKPTSLSEQQMNYIANLCFVALGDFEIGKSPAIAVLREIAKAGIEAQVLPPTITLAQVKHIASTRAPVEDQQSTRN
jgi:hypothetical protein